MQMEILPGKKTKSSESTHRPVSVSVESDRETKNEVYVDLVEQVTALFNAAVRPNYSYFLSKRISTNGNEHFSLNQGEIIRNEIDGKLVIKSYLKGEPELQIGLNPDLQIVGRTSSNSGIAFRQKNQFVFQPLFANIQLTMTKKNALPSSLWLIITEFGHGSGIVDDIHFHHLVRPEYFERGRSVSLHPPDGETIVLNYRISKHSFNIPFRIYPVIEELAPTRADIVIKVLQFRSRLVNYLHEK